MILSSILSYFFIMLVLYVCATIASRRYTISLRHGVANPPFLTPEVLFCIGFFTVAFAIRYNVGVDYLGYFENYESGYKLEYSKNEFLFKHISLFFYKIGAHPIFYFGFFVFVQIAFFLLALKDEKYLYPFLVIFLFCNGEVNQWMNIIRSATAMCIWLYSIKFVEKKQFWIYLICILIAAGIHRSALLYIIIYPLLNLKEIKKPSIPFQLTVLIVAFLIRELFTVFASSLVPIVTFVQTYLGGENDYYQNYDLATMMEDLNREASGTGVAFIVKLILDIVIIFYSKKMHSFYNSRRFNILYVLFIIALFFFYCFPATVISFSRPFRFFFVLRTVMLAFFAYYLWRKRKNAQNQLVLFLTIIIYLGLFVLAQVVCNADACLWYQTWFNQ